MGGATDSTEKFSAVAIDDKILYMGRVSILPSFYCKKLVNMLY